MQRIPRSMGRGVRQCTCATLQSVTLGLLWQREADRRSTVRKHDVNHETGSK